MKFTSLWFSIFIFSSYLIVGCESIESESFNDVVKTSTNRALFVASGTCYTGAVVSSAPTQTVSMYDLDSGQLIKTVVDFNKGVAGDSPTGLEEYDKNHFLVTVDNTAGRRIEKVNKRTGEFSTYIFNPTAFNQTLRQIKLVSDGWIISRSTAIEKFNFAKSRVLSGANPFINAPAGPCATATTLFSDIEVLPNGKIVFIHAAASPNNKIGIISSSGYSTTANCLSVQAAPTTAALPTSVIYHSSGDLLVSYASVTAASNFVYAFDLNITTNVISNATQAYYDTTVLDGISRMVEDPQTGDVFISASRNTLNTIERFSYNPNTKTLTRKGSSPFISSAFTTRCVSAMKVMGR